MREKQLKQKKSKKAKKAKKKSIKRVVLSSKEKLVTSDEGGSKAGNESINDKSSGSVSKDFFAALRAQEASKEKCGTIHSIRNSIVSASNTLKGEKTKDWECIKCAAVNDWRSPSCEKCRALRRMSEWR